LPVLAAEVGGVPEALGRTAAGHVPGLLVAPADAAGFAAALERWLDDPALRSELRDLAVARRATLPSWRDTTTALLAAVNAKADADRRS
jgi:glycosyltransferase involved in cell wall biosynthesis